LIQRESGRFRYHGSFLNEFSESWQAFDEMARAVAAAVPGLAGYAGMDMILTEDGPRVLEINPRLTTSYGGLRQAIGDNPSGIILDMLYNRKFFSGPIQRNRVELRLDE
jgi:predicted ATP-grasp superfamily ATP-dependent carboligase